MKLRIFVSNQFMLPTGGYYKKVWSHAANAEQSANACCAIHLRSGELALARRAAKEALLWQVLKQAWKTRFEGNLVRVVEA